VACRRVLRLTMADVIKGRNLNAVAWRWIILRRLWRYAAFRRDARWIRMLMPRGSI
jgi:hypothetical protein